MMEWTPSNMAPWQSQQYSVRHTRTIISPSLARCLSALSVNCGCGDDPNATVNTDNDKPRARSQIKQIWNKKKEKPALDVVQLVCYRQKWLFFSPEDQLLREKPDFIFLLFDRVWRNIYDRISPDLLKTADQFDKWSAGVDSFHGHRQSSCF